MTAAARFLRRSATAAGALALVLITVALGPVAAGAAAPGTWGAGQYPYLDGTVCTTSDGTSTVTTPLTSWDLGGGRAPGFLTSALTSDGSVDSGAPPLPQVGPQSVADVVPGADGFASSADIATYAALIDRFGQAGPAQAAEVADAIIVKESGAGAQCVDSGQEATLVQEAQQLAGPYRLTFAAQPQRLLPGTPQQVSVTLTSAAGKPVPDVPVTFDGAGITLSPAGATTDANGVATVQASAQAGTSAGTATTLAIHASAALPVGLQQVNGQAVPSTTDPSGSVAAALVAAAPVPIRATKSVALDLSAHPVMHLALGRRAFVLGSAATPRATITGLYGHRAKVTFSIRGPVDVSNSSICANRTAADFGSTVAATSTLVVTGDSTATAGHWQPSKPGCYWVSAALTTLDATPTAHARASVAGPITVLDTAVTLGVKNSLVPATSPVSGTATVTKDYGLPGRLQLHLLGPVQPAPGSSDCAGADFAHAAAQDAGTAPTTGSGDAPPAFTVTTGSTGCYEFAGALVLSLPGATSMRVPVDPATAPHVLAVAPAVSYAMNQVWSFQRGDVSADVTVIGTFDQPVHVQLRMMRVANASLDCRAADYSAATPVGTGRPVAAHTNLSTVAVRSGPLTASGCYEPVPVLTMDGNHAITAQASFDAATSAVAVGASPAAATFIGPAHPVGVAGITSRTVVSAIVFVVLCLLALAHALRTARRMARESLEDPGEPLLLS